MTDSQNQPAPITHEVEGRTYHFDRPTRPQLDRYFAQIRKGLATASVRLATDMAVSSEDRAVLAPILEDMPGIAIEIAQKGLKSRGFKAEQSGDPDED